METCEDTIKFIYLEFHFGRGYLSPAILFYLLYYSIPNSPCFRDPPSSSLNYGIDWNHTFCLA